MISIIRPSTIVLGALLFGLTGCGGSGSDPVTDVSASNLRYTGSLSLVTLNLTGNALDNTIKVSANNTSCTVATATSATSRTAQCFITVPSSRKVDIAVSSSSDYVVYTKTLTAPAPQVTLKTTLGDVVMELDPTAAPVTVQNFLSYVNKSPSFYNGTIFHRVISGSVAQGGGYTSGFVAKTGQSSPIALEVGKGLSNLQGTIAMARTDVLNSAQSQFFFNARDNISYDTLGGGYAVFGKVIEGLNLIIQISNLPATSERPNTEVVITSASQTQ